MSSYVIPVFPAASRVPPRDALAARLAELTGRFAELSSELAAIASAVGSVSGKADKAPPTAPGNLASLDASGNLSDSGATPASIRDAAVAEVIANAPGTMDTLKEIADILGSSQQSGTVLKRISDLESGKVDKAQGKGLSSNDYTAADKAKLAGIAPGATAVSVDPALATQGAAADAKAVGDALRSGYTEWTLDILGEGPGPMSVKWHDGGEVGEVNGWVLWDDSADNYVSWPPKGDASSTTLDWTGSVDSDYTVTAARRLVTPTKTSQLTNDGAPNGGAPYATTAQVEAKQDALSAAQLANIAAVPNKANASDLPYALVTPGEWEFSGAVLAEDNPSLVFEDGSWLLHIGGMGFPSGNTSISALSVDIDTGGMFGIVTATRPSLPGRLIDRAGNRVVVTGDIELTLPAAVPGYLRDFLVRLEIIGSTVPTITFAAPTGETITYETDGDEFPVPDEAGDWLYSFTESCVAHTFAVSLKKVNTVAQGGS